MTRRACRGSAHHKSALEISSTEMITSKRTAFSLSLQPRRIAALRKPKFQHANGVPIQDLIHNFRAGSETPNRGQTARAVAPLAGNIVIVAIASPQQFVLM